MRTLRSRLILSHILPMLLIVPLAGLVLVYVIESQVSLATVSDELVRQAALTADMAGIQPAIWNDAAQAEQFVSVLHAKREPWLTLRDRDGNVLASSLPDGSAQTGQSPDPARLNAALSGLQQVQVVYVPSLHGEVVEVLMPVVDTSQQVVGVVQFWQQVSNLQGQFQRLRWLIVGALGGELLVGVLVGLALALNLGRSLRRVTGAIYGVAEGGQWQTLPEQGPEEIRTLLRAFNALIDRLRLLEESRRHLLANLVHELGRPLGALQSGLQALRGGAAQDPVLRDELLEGMSVQIDRLSPLLDNLAELHGQVLGTLELDRQPTEIAEWLRQVVIPWRTSALEKGLVWKLTTPESLPVVEVDPARLAQVVGNLLSNAIKYTPEGTVSVTADARADEVVIAVSDTGIGIDPAEQARIFEPFHGRRGDKRFPQGMGLGLSIADDLVTAHGGRIEVESAPGKGSRFTVRLPIRKESEKLTEHS